MRETALADPPRAEALRARDPCADNHSGNRALEETSSRSLTFLRGIGLSPDIRVELKKAGYTDEIHGQGWALLAKTSGVSAEITSLSPVADAIRALSEWDSAGFRRIHAALAHLHPEQEKYPFNALEPATGVASVVAVQTLLDRVDSLEGTGPDAESRKASAEEDKKALATLTARGIDSAERKRLRSLVKIARSAPMPSLDSVSAQEAALIALKAWYDDWSETAKAVLIKRGALIRLGLAHRTAHKAEPDGSIVTPTPAPAPAPAPAPIPTPGPVPV